MSLNKVYISLGSNIGDRRQRIDKALAEIGALEGTKVIKVSSIYETAPWGYTDQQNFYNAVALVETSLSPEELLSELLEIEKQGGRVRTFRYAPRTIDIDILLVEGFESDTQFLTVPHPRMLQRAFVLVPLAEIADIDFAEKFGFEPSALIVKEDLDGITKLS